MNATQPGARASCQCAPPIPEPPHPADSLSGDARISFSGHARTELTIGRLRHEKTDLGERVSARVAGKELWVELEGGRLRSTPEAWLSFALLPAMQQGLDIRIESPPPDRRWSANAAKMQTIFREWWGGRNADIQCVQSASWRSRFQIFQRPAAGRAVFFSGGVDSFHALLHEQQRGAAPDALIFVEGFDIDHRDEEKLTVCRAAMQAICATHGIRLLRVRTNLRRLPFFRGTNWEMTHGLAMAGIAHLLQDYGHIGIASSYQWNLGVPYGSRWDLDPLFSSLGKRFSHIAGTISRHDKIAAISDDPLVRNHLRVCWQGNSAHGNCGECEKCLRTSLSLDQLGILHQFPCLRHPEPLEVRLSRITPSYDPLLEMWRALRPSLLRNEVREAMQALFRRSLAAAGTVPSEYAPTLQEAREMAEFSGYACPMVIA